MTFPKELAEVVAKAVVAREPEAGGDVEVGALCGEDAESEGAEASTEVAADIGEEAGEPLLEYVGPQELGQ